MNTNIKIGDLVETCSLLPGVVMKKSGNDIEVRMLHIDEYSTDRNYSCCKIGSCGIVKLTSKQAIKRLNLGFDKLSELWDKADREELDYQKLVDEYES